MIREPLQKWHINTFRPQSNQAEAFWNLDENEILHEGLAFAVIEQNEDQVEEAFAIFWLRPLDEHGRYLALAYLSEDLGPRRLLSISREARDFIDNWGSYRRVEAYSAEDEIDGLHWCRYVLKMDYEGRLRSFLPDGRDMYLFSRVNNGR